MLEFTILLALIICTFMFCLHKWGWISWYELYKPKWLSWCRPCYFCFAFRIAFIICSIMVYLQHDYWFLVVPFASAPVSFLTFKLIIS